MFCDLGLGKDFLDMRPKITEQKKDKLDYVRIKSLSLSGHCQPNAKANCRMEKKYLQTVYLIRA